jgi:hypothetical protein
MGSLSKEFKRAGKRIKRGLQTTKDFITNPSTDSFKGMAKSGLAVATGGLYEPDEVKAAGPSNIDEVKKRVDALAGTSTDPSQSGSASDRMGNLMRAEWEDYRTRFQPYDQKLVGLATSDADNQVAIERARSGVAGSFDVAQGSLQRNQQRLGLSSTPEEVALQSRNSQASKTLAEVGAMNGTRIAALDRDKQILGGDAAAGLKGSRLGEPQ